MAIDTKSLTQIITEFRALQSKDAVSPESLGCILQRIVDLLSTAGTSETITKIQNLLDGFKAAGQAITALSQGQSDRNHIYANKSTVNLANGAVSSTSGIFIQQATTERAGAMRAQQVTDLVISMLLFFPLWQEIIACRDYRNFTSLKNFLISGPYFFISALFIILALFDILVKLPSLLRAHA